MTEPNEESSEAPETTAKYKIILEENDPEPFESTNNYKYRIDLYKLDISYSYASGANRIRTEYAHTKWGARRKTKGIVKRYLKSIEPGFFEEYDA